MQEKYNNTRQGWLLLWPPAVALYTSDHPSPAPVATRAPALPIPAGTQSFPSVGLRTRHDHKATTPAAGPTYPVSVGRGLALLSFLSGCHFQVLGSSCPAAAPQPEPPSAEHVCRSHAQRRLLSLSPKGWPSVGQGSLPWNITPEWRNKKIRGTRKTSFHGLSFSPGSM